MKKFSVFSLIAALAFFVSCQKKQTEEERKAEVERQVQDRLASERVEAEKQRLAQEKANLDAREKALADAIPFKRLGRSGDVARAVMFFADRDNGFVTGQTLYVCGGSSVGTVVI